MGSRQQRIFTPFVTLYAFIWQVLEDDGSCRRATAKVLVKKLVAGKRACSASNASYCRARARLPIEFFEKICSKLFLNLESIKERDKWAWKHGIVKVVDGSGFSVADTSENLKKFSRQNSYKKKQLKTGFPRGRFLGVFCLATGGLVSLKITDWKGKGTGELSLLRKLWGSFRRGETLLGDSIFSNFFVVEKALSLGVHLVAEFPKSRAKNLKQKRRDQKFILKKGNRPKWLDLNGFKQLSNVIEVRIIKINVSPNGFRARNKWILTTHPDHVAVEDIKDLYRQRWNVELNYKSIKTVLGLDHIPVKTPEMVEKHIWVHLIAYNILRIRMAEAGMIGGKQPTKLSFRATQQITLEVCSASLGSASDSIINLFILQHLVGQRPDRYEPRAKKTRPKTFPYLSEARKSAKGKLFKRHKGKKPIS